MKHDDIVPGDTEEWARLRVRRNEIDDEAFEYAEQIEQLRTRLQCAEELLEETRHTILNGRDKGWIQRDDGWGHDYIIQRIDTFLGGRNDDR